MHSLPMRAALTALLSIPMLAVNGGAGTAQDLPALLQFGPRVAGSGATEQARGYLEARFRELGYQTRREAFSYARTDDLGSSIRLGERELDAQTAHGSGSGEITAPLVRVPGLGSAADFAGVDVQGKLAVVQRGQITFAEKTGNALAAGATGVIIVNDRPGTLRPSLGGAQSLPVVGVSAEVGAQLPQEGTLTLSARVQDVTVRAENLVVFKDGARPKVLFGAHLDSVAGAPGANDNLSGTLTVLDIARRVQNTPLAARSYFVLFDGEEDGLHGSRAFVKANPALTRSLDAMFNFDMVGVNVTPLDVGGHPGLREVALAAAPELKAAAGGGGSDHVPFLEAGVPALFYHRGIDPNYHQPGDTLADVDLIEQTADIGVRVAEAVLSAAPAR